MLSGIQFVIDSEGKKIAVQMDLRKYGKIWEDIYDNLVAQSRSKEPRISLESLKKNLKKRGKL